MQSFCFTLPHSSRECTRAHFFISVFIREISGFILFSVARCDLLVRSSRCRALVILNSQISDFTNQADAGFVEFDEALAVEVAEGLFEGFFAGLEGGADFFRRAGVAVGQGAVV